MSTPALEIRGLVAGYGDVSVLRGLDLSIAPGQLVALIGAPSTPTMVSLESNPRGDRSGYTEGACKASRDAGTTMLRPMWPGASTT